MTGTQMTVTAEAALAQSKMAFNEVGDQRLKRTLALSFEETLKTSDLMNAKMVI